MRDAPSPSLDDLADVPSEALASVPRVIDVDFVMVASRGRNPRRRFRFGDVCEAEVCPYWRAERCGVADVAIATAGGDGASPPPACAIRARCCWFEQLGKAACGACPEVITGLLEPEHP